MYRLKSGDSTKQAKPIYGFGKKSTLPALNVDLFSTKRNGKYTFKSTWRDYVDDYYYNYSDDDEEESEHLDESDSGDEDDIYNEELDTSGYEADTDETDIDDDISDYDETESVHYKEECAFLLGKFKPSQKEIALMKRIIDSDQLEEYLDSVINGTDSVINGTADLDFGIETDDFDFNPQWTSTLRDDAEEEEDEMGGMFGVYAESQMLVEFKKPTAD